jgi:hypothetical protein
MYIGEIIRLCKICGDEIDTQKEIERGICRNCDTKKIHDISNDKII